MTRGFAGALALFLTVQCTNYVVRSPEQAPDANDTDGITELFAGKKIALVGFYPFRSFPDQNSGQWVGELVYTPALQKILGFGVPVGSLKTRGTDRRVTQANIHFFIRTYLEQTGKSGIEEMEKLFIPLPRNRYKFRRFDADYFVMGIHTPFVETPQRSVWSALSGPGSCLTLGLVPAYGKYRSRTSVFVFDRRLNLVMSKEYSYPYRTVSSWYMLPFPRGEQITIPERGKSPPAVVFHADLHDFRSDFARFLRDKQ